MPKTNPNGMPEWNGSSASLPPANEWFLYRQTVYFWKPCGCGNPMCDRPLVFNEDSRPERTMTIRARGTEDTGKPEIDMLFKIGATMDEVVDAIEKSGEEGLLELFKTYMEQDPFEKGLVTREEFSLFMQTMLIEAMGLGDMLRNMSLTNNAFGGLMPPQDNNTPFRFSQN